MAVGYILIGWIVGFLTAVTAAFWFDVSWLAAFGLFVGTSVFTAFATILYTAWRMGCFNDPRAPPGRPLFADAQG